MADAPRVGVVGAGHWGPNLARNFAALGALGALCETDLERLARLAERHPDVPAFSGLDAMLASDAVQAVAIASPAVTHGSLTQQALEAGRHVFVEKPLCLDLDQGRRLDEQARTRGLTLMVGHLLWYHPAFDALRRLVSSAGLGELRYIYSNRLSLGKIRREENALWSFAPHDFSMILALAGTMPDRVSANGGSYLSHGVADTTLSYMHFPDGVQAHVFVSWLHPYKDQRLVVVGADGMAVFNDVADGADKLLLYPHRAQWDGDLPVVKKVAAEPIAYAREEPLRRECAHFLDCCATGAKPLSDAAEGLRVLAVLDACQRSLVEGRPIPLGAACGAP